MSTVHKHQVTCTHTQTLILNYLLQVGTEPEAHRQCINNNAVHKDNRLTTAPTVK